MKKLLLLLVFSILLLSCSRNDNDSNTNTNGNKINPPSWIIGKWTSYLDGTAYQSYTFTSSDIVMSIGGYSQSYKYIADNGGYSQTASDTEFVFTLTSGGISQTYKFKKLSSTKLNFDNGASITEFTKQ